MASPSRDSGRLADGEGMLPANHQLLMWTRLCRQPQGVPKGRQTVFFRPSALPIFLSHSNRAGRLPLFAAAGDETFRVLLRDSPGCPRGQKVATGLLLRRDKSGTGHELPRFEIEVCGTRGDDWPS